MICARFPLVLGLSLPVLFISSLVIAEEPATELGEIVVTADRSARSVDDTLAAVSIITREDIEGIQAVNISDILRLQPGVNVSRTGNAGNQTSVFLRGTESDHALVLIDGVRVSSSINGAFDWSNFPVDQIERMEIVRGSRAALYGSDAIGGVIQIFTRRSGTPYGAVTVGKYGTKKASAGLSVGDKTQFSANVSAENSESFSSQSLAGGGVVNQDNDGYQKRSLTLGFSHAFSPSLTVGADILHASNASFFDAGSDFAPDDGQQAVKLNTQSLYLKSDITDNWSQKLRLSTTKNDLNSNFSDYVTDREELDWQNDFSVSDNLNVIFGANYRKEAAKTADYDRNIDDKALFVNLSQQNNRLKWDISGRYDTHSLAGSKSTGQVAVGYDVSASINSFISYGSAFKAPTMDELFYPGFFGSFAGNPDLKPETSTTSEIGIKSTFSKEQRLQLSVYRTSVNNLINTSGVNNQAINIDEVSLQGLEVDYAGAAKQWDWGINATLQKSENDNTGQRLIRRPNTKITSTVGYAMSEKTQFSLDVVHASTRDDIDFDAAFNPITVKLAPYTLVNLSAQHQLNKRVSLGLRVENATDEDYQLVSGYNTAGRAAYVSVSYQ